MEYDDEGNLISGGEQNDPTSGGNSGAGGGQTSNTTPTVSQESASGTSPVITNLKVNGTDTTEGESGGARGDIDYDASNSNPTNPLGILRDGAGGDGTEEEPAIESGGDEEAKEGADIDETETMSTEDADQTPTGNYLLLEDIAEKEQDALLALQNEPEWMQELVDMETERLAKMYSALAGQLPIYNILGSDLTISVSATLETYNTQECFFETIDGEETLVSATGQQMLLAGRGPITPEYFSELVLSGEVSATEILEAEEEAANVTYSPELGMTVEEINALDITGAEKLILWMGREKLLFDTQTEIETLEDDIDKAEEEGDKEEIARLQEELDTLEEEYYSYEGSENDRTDSGNNAVYYNDEDHPYAYWCATMVKTGVLELGLYVSSSTMKGLLGEDTDLLYAGSSANKYKEFYANQCDRFHTVTDSYDPEIGISDDGFIPTSGSIGVYIKPEEEWDGNDPEGHLFVVVQTVGEYAISLEGNIEDSIQVTSRQLFGKYPDLPEGSQLYFLDMGGPSTEDSRIRLDFLDEFELVDASFNKDSQTNSATGIDSYK